MKNTGECFFFENDLAFHSLQHGGQFIQNPGSNTHCVIADRQNVRVKNVIR